mgnify:CR=1 FL=1
MVLNVSGFAKSTSTLRQLTEPFTTQKRRFFTMTLQELIQQKCPTSTCSSADCLVSPILRHQEIQEDLSIPEEFYSLKLPELSKTSDLRLFCWRMCPRSFGISRGKLTERSFTRFQNWGIVLNGWCLTAQPLILPKRGKGSILSDIAVRNAPAKYSLSSAAIARLLLRLSEDRKAQECTPPREQQ